MVTAAKELGTENAGTGHGTEDAEVEDKDQLVGDGNTGHLGGTHRSDHNVVQHIHEVGEAVLHHNGQHQQYEAPIERLVAHESFQHGDSLLFSAAVRFAAML